MEIDSDRVLVRPVIKAPDSLEIVTAEEARPDGPFSGFDVSSNSLARRLPEWFDAGDRVDRMLLTNLSVCVREVAQAGYGELPVDDFSRRLAELLMGQVLFVSYLEHRGIVSDVYRSHHKVGRLHQLVTERDIGGVRRLIDRLKEDFNGDFLSDDRHDPWQSLNAFGFEALERFLNRTDMSTGQGDFWNYDFSLIPVELLSGLYESFLSEDVQSSTGAYYTPRHLAMLAVDQAFSASADPLQETVFDGACGSGILLTTAFRRMIALTEAREGSPLSFKQRRQLLARHIFGADINEMACRVTAFSLYLSLLEGLDPSDIREAQSKERVKLPTLKGVNLLFGATGDFFSPDHGFNGRTFSLVLSNPPWIEPRGSDVTSADIWAQQMKAPVGHRQVAAAFSIRALEFLSDGGRLCLILPINLFLGPSKQSFVKHLFETARPIRLINFGDFQNLLFPSAEHTCHVLLAEKRNSRPVVIAVEERFDYCVPKADMSLAYGRLTLSSNDRHSVATRAVIDQQDILTVFMWGDAFDQSLLHRLGVFGELGDYWSGPKKTRRWQARKGIHIIDRQREPVSAEPLRGMPHVATTALGAGVPVLHPDLLQPWPEEIDQVSHISDEVLEVFKGPRILYTDGFSKEDLSVRAAYTESTASFTASVGVISGPHDDARLLRFVAAYLRSTLARYVLMFRSWTMLCERNAVRLVDIGGFPFHEPENADKPEVARRAFDRTVELMLKLEGLPDLEQRRAYEDMESEIDEHLFDYFAIDAFERAIISETVALLLPSIRPRSFGNLDTPAQTRAGLSDVRSYVRALATALDVWIARTNGNGRFDVSALSSSAHAAGGMGAIRIYYKQNNSLRSKANARSDSDALMALLNQARADGFGRVSAGFGLGLAP
ncbi:MAG TPA: DNA methylase, partial [Hyphomonas sp.]|nr:DNA methylase [Hyphomonas sp.]